VLTFVFRCSWVSACFCFVCVSYNYWNLSNAYYLMEFNVIHYLCFKILDAVSGENFYNKKMLYLLSAVAS
ncbi:hypothetical protein L9F63_020881, partial [Diploptera punctata]